MPDISNSATESDEETSDAETSDASDAGKSYLYRPFTAFLTLKVSLPALPARITGCMVAFHAMRPLRNPQCREGRNTILTRSSNMEAHLAQAVGTINNPECSHCARGSGPWETCVSVNQHLSQSCANCHYNNEGRRCSLSTFRVVFELLETRTNITVP
jgi:hypothetical protein